MVDDTFVIIVGDEDDDYVYPEIKKERVDEIDTEVQIVQEEVDGIIDIAKKYGVCVDLDIVKKEIDADYDNDEDISQFVSEDFDDFIIPENDVHDQDYTPNENNEDNASVSDDPYLEYIIKSRKKKRDFVRFSFVKQFIKEDLELQKNKKLLINTLVDKMKSMKPPPPPKGAYRFEDLQYCCNFCKIKTLTEPAASRHYQEYHGPRYLNCFACGADYRSKTSLYRHEKRCQADYIDYVLKARSLFIGSKARSRPYLNYAKRKRQKKGKQPPQFHCTKCSASFRSAQVLTSHEYFHQGIRPFLCGQCPSAYTSSAALGRHIKTHNNEEFICDICKRSFKTKSSLATHLDIHLPLKKFGCDQCERRYTQKAALMLHIDRVHKKLPPAFPCKICEKRYPKLYLLEKHMKREHGVILLSRNKLFKEMPTLGMSNMVYGKIIESKDQTLAPVIDKQEDEDYAKEVLEYAAKIVKESKDQQNEFDLIKNNNMKIEVTLSDQEDYPVNVLGYAANQEEGTSNEVAISSDGVLYVQIVDDDNIVVKFEELSESEET